MRHHTLLAIALLAGSAIAQTTSSTLPKGWDTTEGTDSYGAGTANSYFWNGFGITSSYLPARALYSYDASTFPWDASANSHIITKLSFRSDGPTNPGKATAHKKKMVVIISTSSHHPAQANFNHFDGNHGKNRTVVYGTIGTGKDVTFPATVKPKSGAAPFDVAITLDKLFVVPKGAKTLVIEVRSYSSDVTTGWWFGDSTRYDGANYNGGAFARINTDHCVTPSIFYTSRAVTLGSNFGHIWRPSQSPGGKNVFTWIGPRAATPFLFPGSKACKVHVFPVLVLRADTSEKSGAYSVYVDWGRIPVNSSLVGVKVPHQSMFVDSAYPGGVGLTRGGESTIGTGYDQALVKASAVYSHGANTTRYTGKVDADAEPYARYFYRRVPIMKIN